MLALQIKGIENFKKFPSVNRAIGYKQYFTGIDIKTIRINGNFAITLARVTAYEDMPGIVLYSCSVVLVLLIPVF